MLPTVHRSHLLSGDSTHRSAGRPGRLSGAPSRSFRRSRAASPGQAVVAQGDSVVSAVGFGRYGRRGGGAYAAATELSIADLLELFNADGWRPRFGGKKWAAIVQTAQTLITAVDVGDWKGANVVCDQIAVIEHNSGPLVPSLSEWTEQARLKEKWPQLCG